MGWNWEYEPFELSGYIPDFIVNIKGCDYIDNVHSSGYEHMLVEVKGDFNLKIDDLDQYANKIINSGWKGCFLIVGTRIYDSYQLEKDPSEEWLDDHHHRAVLGLFYYWDRDDTEFLTSLTKTFLYLQPAENEYAPLYINDNGNWLHGSELIYKPLGYYEFHNDENSYDVVDKIFQECKNKTQWKPN